MIVRLPRRLLVWFIAVLGIALLALFVACMALQIQVPWQTTALQRFSIKQYRFYYARKDINNSLEYLVSTENELDITKEPDRNSDRNSDQNSDQSSDSQQSDLQDIPDSKLVTPKPNTNVIKEEPNIVNKTFKPEQNIEYDFFGDQYYSEDFPSQKDCPKNIRKYVHKTNFSEMFLHTIPVLQWSKHLTLDEYERLRHYSGAHGWGSVSLDVLKSSLALLNTTANRVMFDDWEMRKNRSACIRCAVVGNGGILNGSKKGKEIDEHDYVFRVNGAVLKGYEEDVGSRTSFYTFSTNTMRNSIRSYGGLGYRGPPLTEETRYIFLPDHDRDYILMRAAATHTIIENGPERSKTPPKYFGENASVKSFKIYHPDFIRYLRNRFLHSRLLRTGARRIYRPSTGAVMLLAAIHTCDQVDAYGFMTPDWKSYSDHYYDTYHKPVRFFANHDMRMEMRLWQELHHAGLMNLFMRQ